MKALDHMSEITAAPVAAELVRSMAPHAAGGPALRCRGADLIDENGAVVKLKGVNWFGFNTGTTMVDGLWGADPLPADFAAVVLRQKLLGETNARLQRPAAARNNVLHSG